MVAALQRRLAVIPNNFRYYQDINNTLISYYLSCILFTMKPISTTLLSLSCLAQLAHGAAVLRADGNDLSLSAATLATRRDLPLDPPTILMPLSNSEPAPYRLSSHKNGKPAFSHNVSLVYGAGGIKASIAAALTRPAVVLEDLPGIASVKCSGAEMALAFHDDAAFETASKTWPKSDFIIITHSPDGACNTVEERGFYIAKSHTSNAESRNIIVEVTASSLKDQSKGATINFQTGVTPVKRDISGTVTANISGKLVETDHVTVTAEQARFESTIHLKGRLDLDILRLKAKAIELDIDFSALASLNLSASVTGDYSTELLNLKPLAVSVSPFSILGVVSVGPIAEFGLGIEFGADGNLNATLDADAGIRDGKVHLDLLDSKKTTANGWEPSVNVASDVDALVRLQLNPFIELSLAVGIKAFNGIVDLSAGVAVKPKVINAFSVNGEVALNSDSGVKFNPPAKGECTNGAWFASILDLDVDAYVSPLFKKTLVELQKPIYKSQCWTLAK